MAVSWAERIRRADERDREFLELRCHIDVSLWDHLVREFEDEPDLLGALVWCAGESGVVDLADAVADFVAHESSLVRHPAITALARLCPESFNRSVAEHGVSPLDARRFLEAAVLRERSVRVVFARASREQLESDVEQLVDYGSPPVTITRVMQSAVVGEMAGLWLDVAVVLGQGVASAVLYDLGKWLLSTLRNQASSESLTKELCYGINLEAAKAIALVVSKKDRDSARVVRAVELSSWWPEDEWAPAFLVEVADGDGTVRIVLGPDGEVASCERVDVASAPESD